MSKYYMHTISDKPAYFDGTQIVFCTFYGRGECNTLVNSLERVKREQQATIRYRKEAGFDYDIGEYNYVRVYTPDKA